jgi:hypothetical protein
LLLTASAAPGKVLPGSGKSTLTERSVTPATTTLEGRAAEREGSAGNVGLVDTVTIAVARRIAGCAVAIDADDRAGAPHAMARGQCSVTGRPVAISDHAMAVPFDLARPLAPRDRTLFIEDVVKELDGHTEIGLGLVNRVAIPVQRRYLGFARGAGRVRFR